MRNRKNLLIIILLLLVVLETGYIISSKNPRTLPNNENVTDYDSPIQNEVVGSEKKYTTDLPLEYFEGRVTGGGGAYTYLEMLGYQGEIVPVTDDEKVNYKNISEAFYGFEHIPVTYPPEENKEVTEPIMNVPERYFLYEPHWDDPIDVDKDGIQEQIFYYATAMNHTPHIAVIVKNDIIVFQAGGPGIQIEATENGNGFYTREYQWTDIPTANTKITRYIYEDGEFKPVWYRRIYVLEVSNGINQISDFYPFKEGSYWEYSGTKKEQQSDSSIQESTVTKKIKVDSIERDGKITTIYTDNEDIPKITFNGEYLDFNPDSTSEQKFTLPITLYKGARWGDEGNLENRDDGYYVWEVENDLQREFNGKTYSCYHISYKQLPDTKYYIFCRGLGILEEGYKHNGTVMEYKYELVSTNAVN